jgi:hypothetical protein
MKRFRARPVGLWILSIVLAGSPLLAQGPGERVPNWPVPSITKASHGGMTTQSDIGLGGAAFIPVTPCRIVNTRDALFPPGFGPPSLLPGAPGRNFALLLGPCIGFPPAVLAYSLNITVTNTLGPGFIKVFPQGGALPPVSTLNYNGVLPPGQAIANAAIVPAGTGSGITVLAGVSGTDLLIDINGYFIGNGNAAPLNPNEFVGFTGNLAGGPLVFGSNTNASGFGVLGVSPHFGVFGVSNGVGLAHAGVRGESTDAIGTFGMSTNVNGVWAQSTNQDGLFSSGGRDGGFLTGGRFGVFGVSTGNAGSLAGLIGSEQSGDNGSAGVRGVSFSGPPNGGSGAFQFNAAGVLGLADSAPDFEAGVQGITRSGGGFGGRFTMIRNASPFDTVADVFLARGGGSAALFEGNVSIVPWGGGLGDLSVVGTVSKGGGSFKIDHPLDPENKYLYHSFVESPDMMNIYNGNVVLDQNGEAIVQLPAWFEALNMDFRYQLTSIGRFSPVYIADEIQDNQFRIAGGRPGTKVSWQVTGIRHDAFANAHRIQVEVEKEEEARGFYLHPAEHGKPLEMSLSPRLEQARALREKQEANARPATDK